MKWSKKICVEYIQKLKDPMLDAAKTVTPVADIGAKLTAMADKNQAGVDNGNNKQNTPAVY